jgi:CRP-like cAMP-binding protein
MADLLTTARLGLNGAIRKSNPQPGCVYVRSPHSRVRLVLTPTQYDLLNRNFAQPSTVSEVLVRLLQAQNCPALSEYYELITRAHGAGVLETAETPAGVAPVRDWRWSLPPKIVGLVAGVSCLLALFALGLALALAKRGAADPIPIWGWLGGWVLTCGLLSAGEALAGCVLAGAGCEVRWPHFHRRSFLPAFRVDLAEAVMGGRDCVRAVAAVRVAPLIIGAAVIAWKMPVGLLPLLVGLLYVLAPWSGSAMAQVLESLRERPRFSVHSGQAFLPEASDLWADGTNWWAGVEPKVALGWSGWALAWSLLLGATLRYFFPAWSAGLLAWSGQVAATSHTLRVIFVYSAIAVLVILLLAVGRAAWRHWRLMRQWAGPTRQNVRAGAPALQGGVTDMLRQLVLFQGLPEEELAVLAGAMTEVPVGKGQNIFQENDPGDAFYIVIEGQLEVRKHAKEGARGSLLIGWLGPGEAFGEIALLENIGRTTTIRATSPGRLLRLMKTDFERLVVGRVGVERIRGLLQNARFLSRLSLLGDWPFEDLIRYAQHCRSLQVPAGTRVLKKGEPNLWFHLIFDGAFEARDKDRVLRRMGPGDYFGEISLLANEYTTADVVAVEESRCLIMGREDFLVFFSRDFHIGLRMESQASQRLGKNMFASRRGR